MSQAALLALLWALAALTLARCWHRPPLRRAAAALVVLALASSVRHALGDGPQGAALRLDVALSLLWPAAAAWLIAGWPALAWVAYAVALALWGRHLAPWWGWALRAPRVAVAVLATGATWRRVGGAHPAIVAKTAGDEPSDDPAAGVGAPGLWTASQRVGLLLAAGQTASVVTGLWVDWGDVRWISAGIYVAIGALVVLREPRAE